VNILRKVVNTLKRQPLPRVAMFMCIHNEERFLEAHLRYHRAMGVSRAYVFLDRCDDASLQIAQSFPWVEPVVVNDRLHTISPFYSDLFRVCADHARRMAHAEGFDWLLCLDVDEFVFANKHSVVRETDFDLTGIPLETILRAGHLPSMVATVAPKTEAIFLANWNIVPGKSDRNDPFWKLHFFYSRILPPQLMCDPLTGQTEEYQVVLGSRGKSMVSTKADIQCLSSHEWVRSQGYHYTKRPARIPITTKNQGFLYHFYTTDSQHWREKYQKLSRELTVWYAGNPVDFRKECGKRASAVLSDEEIELYLNEWIYLSTAELEAGVKERLLRKADMVEKVITGVELNELADTPPNRAEIDKILTMFRETERQIITLKAEEQGSASPQTRPASPRKNKTNSGELPPVSCVCLPESHLASLEEAIFSFLQQDYQGPKELVILNDTPGRVLEFDHPEIRIINLPKPFSEPGQKRNTAISLCAHDLIFIWDDDGIYLPHCISFSIEKFGRKKGFFKPTRAFVLSDGALRVPRQNIFHSGTCFTRGLFDRARGYTFHENLHFYREELEAQFERKQPHLIQYHDIAIENIAYIYKWGGVELFQNKDAAQPEEISREHIKLNPHWKMDYPELVRNYLKGMAVKSDDARPLPQS
jgi:hypothetical protein